MDHILSGRKNIGYGCMTLKKKLWRQRWLFLFCLPGFLFFLIFAYAPMFGVIIAFEDFDPARGFFASPFVGWANFKTIFSVPAFLRALRNTLAISALKLAVVFPASIVFALLINEITFLRFKRVIQTITYLPYFISWVIVSGLFYKMLAIESGVVNDVLRLTGLTSTDIMFMGRPDMFYGIAVFTDLWKNLGFNAIIYLAALAGINPELYEAATVDGAGRFRRTWHISLPGILPTVILMLIMAAGGLMYAGFDQMWTLGNIQIRETAEILDTLILRNLKSAGIYSLGPSGAMGLFTSVCSFLLFILANGLARAVKQESLI